MCILLKKRQSDPDFFFDSCLRFKNTTVMTSNARISMIISAHSKSSLTRLFETLVSKTPPPGVESRAGSFNPIGVGVGSDEKAVGVRVPMGSAVGEEAEMVGVSESGGIVGMRGEIWLGETGVWVRLGSTWVLVLIAVEVKVGMTRVFVDGRLVGDEVGGGVVVFVLVGV